MIIMGDALTELQKLDDGTFDAVITDPPFGIGFLYGDKKEKYSHPIEYWEWLSPIYFQINRVLKPGGFIAIWQSQKYLRHSWEWFGDDIHIYSACKNFVQLRKTTINFGFDPVIFRYKMGTPLRPIKPKRNLDFFVSNTAAIVSNKYRIERGHPCPRPFDVVNEIVSNFVLPGGKILDPFMGSGTTGLAAKKNGMDFMGIEINQDYFLISKKRIESESNP
jgi:DNA modification methylase